MARHNVWIQNAGSALVSGAQIDAKVSGQILYIGSTNTINIATIIGGSSDSVSTANNGLVTTPMLRAFDQNANQWVRLRASAAVSGQGYELHTQVKGPVLISGQKIGIIDDGVNNVVKISGQVVHSYGTQFVTAPMVACVDTSGGTQLPNQSCVKARVRSVSGNKEMFVGGVGSQAPFSGKGQILYGGEAIDVDVNNFNAIRVMGTVAGEMVAVDGVL